MSDAEIERVLHFWFSDTERDSPRVDSRMERWFSSSPELDEQIREQFMPLIEKASSGELMDWAESPRGRLALIILLDQFRRNVYRGSAAAYSRDKLALKVCIEGTMNNDYKSLDPFQRLFFFMPLQHAESLKVQEKSVGIFRTLAESVSETLEETFQTTAQFAELHHDIIERFGRFRTATAFSGGTTRRTRKITWAATRRLSGINQEPSMHYKPTRRVAIIAGQRIPFARAHTNYAQSSNQDMMTAVLKGIVDKFNLTGVQLGDVSLGAVIKHSKRLESRERKRAGQRPGSRDPGL